MAGDSYKNTNRIEYLAGFPGADREKDRVDVSIVGSIGLEISKWTAGNLPVDQQTPVEIGSYSGGPIPVEQQTPVGVEDSGGSQVDPATDTTLTNTLSREIATWSAGTLSVQESSALDVSGATVPVEHQGVIDVSSRDGRNLGDVDVTDLPHNDEAHENSTALASDGTVTNSLAAPGADTLRGRIVRSSTSYDVTVAWEDANGNTLFTDSIASGVAGGTETTINEPAVSPYCTVTVSDAGSGSGAVTETLHLR